MTQKILQSKKVFLRPPTVEDFAEISALYKASRQFHRGLVQAPIKKKAFDKYIVQSELDASEYFLICRSQDDKIAGSINLSQIFRGNFKNAYLGYYLAEEFSRKGYMTEAVRLILRFAFRHLKLHRLEANVQPGNAASIAVLQKTGFTKEGFSQKYLKIGGRWRDHERWAIIAENYKLSRNNGNKRA
jgi:ribosomal-protein-alanine N-acetyltransferase